MHYKKEYERLNSSQKKAVDAIEGPLMVIAGPGTGKTQLLAMRVANILQKTDTDASSILCLTFTNKAATNMRSRILKLTDNKATDVNVKTFHSFATEIINSYPDYFWSGARLSTAPDTLQLEIVQNILTKLPLDNPLALQFAGKYTLTSEVINSLKLVKEAGLTPDKLRAIIDFNLSYIDAVEPELITITQDRLSLKKLPDLIEKVDEIDNQNIDAKLAPLVSLSTILKDSLQEAVNKDENTGKTTHLGRWKSRWIQNVEGKRGMHTERARNLWWKELSTVYDEYRIDLHGSGYFDYSDMIVEVITQIEKHPEMRSDIQERFGYVMIDEFQDTNLAQLRLAHLVADHHTNGDNPNIMVVGDDDQSIFKFNGAELGNMLSFRRSYPSTKVIVLTENYRSTQDILDVASCVIEHSKERLVHSDKSLDKRLVAKASLKNGRIQSTGFTDRESQLSGVALDIQKKYKSDQTIAVLARSHSSLRDIAARLIGLGVPIHYEQQQNALDNPLVLQSILIMDVVTAIQEGDIENASVALSKTLAHPMWGITTLDLHKIAICSRKAGDWLATIRDNDKTSWISDWLLELSRLSTYEPLPVTLEYIIGLRLIGTNKSPIHDAFKINEDANEYLYGLSSLQYLRKLAAEYSGIDDISFDQFVNYLRLEKQNERTVTDQSVFVSGSNAVNLLTIHKAKGLEFNTVYILDLVENIWQPRKGGRKPPANLPLQPVGDDMDDYTRLLYVATTRAEQNLYVSYYTHDDLGNETLPSSLISDFPNNISNRTKLDPISTLEDAITWPTLSSSELKPLLRSTIEKYSLSVTHLLNFLDVSRGGPKYFFERNILRLPEAKSVSMAFGTAMHDALECAQKNINNDSYSLEKSIKAFSESLRREQIQTENFNRYLQKGEKLLKYLLGDNRLKLVKGALPEQTISDIYLEEAKLSGKLDNIVINDDTIIVTDYKTGRSLPSIETKNVNMQITAWRQKTQLIYYALLIQLSPRYKQHRNKRIIGQIIYLEATGDKKMILKYEPTKEDIDTLKNIIIKVWSMIQELDLPNVDKYASDISGIEQFQIDLLNS